jgi:6-phosphogluconolactonase (cycloisomerase 2 family)
MQSFSLDLSNGHTEQINNVSGPLTVGTPGMVIIDPAGTFAYVASVVSCAPSNLPPNTQLTALQGAIVTYQIASDGKMSAGTTQYLKGNAAYPGAFPTCGLDDSTNPNSGNSAVALAIDSAGKYLFVAEGAGSATYTIDLDSTPSATVATLNSPGVAVYAIGSNASLTEVPGSPFPLPTGLLGTPTPSALALTPTAYPPQFAPCSGHTAPSTENLYVTDSINNTVLNYLVTSSGALTLVPAMPPPAPPGVPTGALPSGVAVDACGQFAFVANATTNNVSAYTICSALSVSCQMVDFSLHPVTGSPFPAGDAPGPIAVDPFAKFVYVVDTGSSQVSGYRISPASGSLTAISGTPVATNSGPNSIAIRDDGTWIFVANFNSGNISQYSITQSTGTLNPQVPFTTFNDPTGVAVK